MAIDTSSVTAMILADACEDYHGLYEIIWSLNARDPAASADAKLRVAQQALSDLVRRGLVSLYTTVWPRGAFDPVSEGLAEAAIGSASSWAAPPAAPVTYFCFAATAAGEAAYHCREVEQR